jgi:uncharacterized protein (TIGR03435 family)
LFGIVGFAMWCVTSTTSEGQLITGLNVPPQFDVVSIKPNPGNFATGPPIERPDGGLRMTRVPAMSLIARAYPPAIPNQMIGLPQWAKTEYYDVVAAASLPHATPADRAAMLRAMLADRFKLIAHFEDREEPIYELVLARKDGRLGSGLTPTEIDCAAQLAAERAAAEAGTPPPRPGLSDPAPRCRLLVRNDRMEGDSTMENLAGAFRMYSGRTVVDKTGLSGFYRVTMTFDAMFMMRRDPVPPPDAPPSIFTAVQEQLGLKLQPERMKIPILVVDHIERPTPN